MVNLKNKVLGRNNNTYFGEAWQTVGFIMLVKLGGAYFFMNL